MQLEAPRAAAVSRQMPGSLALRRFFSFPATIGALLVLLAIFTVRSRFNDPDMWWHLKTGEIIWKTHSIPRVDPFSFTANGHAWIAQEWLSELTIYCSHRLAGYTGLMLWLCVFASFVFVAGYALCWLYSGNAKVAFMGALGIWLFSSVGLAVRPHMIGYVLLVSELLILHLGRSYNGKWFFLLPAIFAIWVNCHSSFFFGLVVLAVCLLCAFLNFRLGLLQCERWNSQKRRDFMAACALSCAALFLNPIGPKLVVYPLDVMLHQPLNLQSISEWQQPDFAIGRSLAVLLVAGLILAIPFLRCIDLHFDELLLFALVFWFAVRHERMLFVFGIVVMPILCRLLATAWDTYELAHDRVLPNAILIVLSLFIAALGFPNIRNLQQQVESGNPVKALEFIRHSNFSGRMLNEYIYGGYLIWAAPERKVFIDGRADIYEPAGVLADYQDWSSLRADPKLLLDKYKIEFCLLTRGSGISRVIPLLTGWKTVYSDDSSIVFLRSGALTR